MEENEAGGPLPGLSMSRTIELTSPNREFELVISDTEVTLNQMSPQPAGASNAKDEEKKAKLERGDDEPSARRSNRNMEGSIT